MSAIAGIVRSGERAADPAPAQMLRAMIHRSPDGSAVRHLGRASLGHGLLRTVPEGQPEVLPLSDGHLTLTADARLDNRGDLIVALGLTGGRSVSDAAIILAAYRRWGEACPEHLLGDFAFALWDGERDLLFCARDHFGVKPFYFHAGASAFVFASEIKALFAVDVPRRIDEARIADYLVGLVEDSQSTLYADIRRLPPRHSLTVTATGLRLREYWRLDPTAAATGADLAEQFRDLFTTAVRCRLRSVLPPGGMLSGGLDSSSIACVAAPIVDAREGRAFPTLSLVFDKTPAWNERPFIEAVLARGGFDPSFVPADDYAPFADLDRILAEQEGVFLAPGLGITRRLYSAAADRGIRVLLDGHGGDEVVSHGLGRLHELARTHRWLALWGEARGVAGTYGEPTWRVFASYLERYGPSRRLAKARRTGVRALRRLRSGNQPTETRPGWSRFVNPDLAAKTDLAARYARNRMEAEVMGSERGQHAWYLSSGRLPHAFEVLDRAAAAAGIEPRYPFWDKRLVEFCLSLPSEAKLKGGWTRLILRQAMEGILPPAVQWRRDKLDFGPHVIRGMRVHHAALLDRVINGDACGVGGYVDLPQVAAAYRRIVELGERADGNDVKAVSRTVGLALWFEQLGRAPARAAAAA